MSSPDQTYARCAWRLIPFMMLLYLVSFIDRTNVGFAALTMNRDLGFSPSVFGLGAGLFFVTYILGQVPATVLTRRYGARRVIAVIMVTWGLLAAANALVRDVRGFYALRLLLGLAEAGFLPGMLYYLTLWFPQRYRARYTAWFTAGIPLAGIIGGPISGLILGMDGMAGLHGWQWLFIVEGLPATLLGFIVHRFLPDGPVDAAWLDSAERATITANLMPDEPVHDRGPWRALADGRVWALGFAGIFNACSVYALVIWLPQMIQAMGYSNGATGFIVTVPYLAGMVAMIAWGRSSDARGDRIGHLAIGYLFTAASFAAACVVQGNVAMLACLTTATMGVYSIFGPYYTLPSSFLGGSAKASGIAAVNAIGNIGGLVGPYFVGVIRERTGGYAGSMAVLVVVELMAVTTILLLGRRLARR